MTILYTLVTGLVARSQYSEGPVTGHLGTGFFLVSLCLKANAEMVPKTPSCYCMIIIIISFMQGIYIYIPETNYVHREYSVAAVLLLLFMVLLSLVSVLNLLHFYISTLRSMCAVLNMAVFCSSLTSCFPGMFLTYFLLLLLLLLLLIIIINIIIIIITTATNWLHFLLY
jgi:hypothetical protein